MGGQIVPAYTVGQTGTLYDSAAQVPLATINVASPQFSTSDSSSDTPKYGYFASFTVTVSDVAPSSTHDNIGVTDQNFYVQEPDGTDYGNGGQPKGVLEGNGDEAYTTNELGVNGDGASVDLSPGQSMTGSVIVDCPDQHGSLFFEIGGRVEADWTF